MSGRQAYRPDIDGLRAVAIILVVIYHFGIVSKGGFVGVDVFFVISGYLITSILLGDIASGRFSLANFYERRVRRIVPALFACLIVTTLGAYLFLYPMEFVLFAKSALAATAFSANLFFRAMGGYFQPSVEVMPLIHTWSLSVEEQFYIVFPLILFALMRYQASAAPVAIAAIAVASLGFSQSLVLADPVSAFYLLSARAWELMIGSLFAFGAIPAVTSHRSREVLSVGGLLAIVAAGFAFNKNTTFPGAMALIPCLGAVAIIHTGSARDTRVYRLLASAPMVFVGLISYSLYLWHVPIFTFFRLQTERQSIFDKFALIVVSVIVAYLSWKFVELPFRKKSASLGRPQVFGLAFAAAATVASLAGLTIYQGGFPQRFSPLVRRLAAFDYSPEGPMRDGSCFVSRAAAKNSEFDAKTCLSVKPERKNVLIVGDSFAAHHWAGFSQTFPEVNFLQATASGCSADLIVTGSDRCRAVMANLFQSFLPAAKLDAAIFTIHWSRSEMAAALTPLEQLKKSAAHVYVLGPMPEYSSPLPRLLTLSALRQDPGIIERARLDENFALDRELKTFFADKGVVYVSLMDAICQGKSCMTTDDRQNPLQFDYGHLTENGSALVARLIGPEIGLRAPAAGTPGFKPMAPNG